MRLKWVLTFALIVPLSGCSLKEKWDWSSAFKSGDVNTLQSCSRKYPNSPNVPLAKEKIWEIQWPPVILDKADNVTIYSHEGYVMRGSFGIDTYGNPVAWAHGLKAVVIFRDLAQIKNKKAAQLELRTGLAYLQEGEDHFRFIRKVDLSKSDDALMTEFGLKKE